MYMYIYEYLIKHYFFTQIFQPSLYTSTWTIAALCSHSAVALSNLQYHPASCFSLAPIIASLVKRYVNEGTTSWGECTYKGIPILPQHFPLYSSQEVVPLLPYLLHLWVMTYIIMSMRESPFRGECTSSWTIHVQYSSTNASRLDPHW